jgi:FkbM family methyltransferase
VKSILSGLFRLFFRYSFFRKRFFGIHTRVFNSGRLFKGVYKTISLKNGIRFELDIGDWIQENLFFLGEYEPEELGFVAEQLKTGDVFIDVGANIGLYTLHAAGRVGDSGIVIAFEPVEKTFRLLENNVSLNNFSNIRVENLALSDKEKPIEIFTENTGTNSGMASSYLEFYSDSIRVDAVSLDGYLDRNPPERVDFIKMDIEGGEYPALLGMKKTLQRFSPMLLVEIDEKVLETTPYYKNDILSFLDDLGYEQHSYREREGKNYVFRRKR